VVALAAPATDNITATAAVAATARVRDARMVFPPESAPCGPRTGFRSDSA
jgi:hypothetical protein